MHIYTYTLILATVHISLLYVSRVDTGLKIHRETLTAPCVSVDYLFSRIVYIYIDNGSLGVSEDKLHLLQKPRHNGRLLQVSVHVDYLLIL